MISTSARSVATQRALYAFADRLENEHLGNMDQYRVTREVPLPYTFDEQVHEDDEDEEDRKSISSWRSKRKAAKSRSLHGDLPTTSPDTDSPVR